MGRSIINLIYKVKCNIVILKDYNALGLCLSLERFIFAVIKNIEISIFEGYWIYL